MDGGTDEETGRTERRSVMPGQTDRKVDLGGPTDNRTPCRLDFVGMLLSFQRQTCLGAMQEGTP